MGQSSVSRQSVAVMRITIVLTVSFLVCGSAVAQHHIVREGQAKSVVVAQNGAGGMFMENIDKYHHGRPYLNPVEWEKVFQSEPKFGWGEVN
jgi:hypothetical protein